MAAKRLTVKKIKEILRLRLGEQRSLRDVARSVGTSPSRVHECVLRFQAAGLVWPLDLEEEDLDERLYKAPARRKPEFALPDFAQVERERRRKGVTLSMLWDEYKSVHRENGYQYSRFCELYREWKKHLDVTMRHEHKAGEKAFVDWSGDGISVVNRETGEVKQCPLFVGVLGGSGLTFAKATSSRESRNWIRCHIEMYEYFGGVPAVTVPDNEKTGVRSPCLYEPDLNPTYADLARHYDTAVIPTRARKPRDKALVENAVLNVQRWLLGRFRNHVFFDLEQANALIEEQMEEYNSRKYQRMNVSRRELFEQIERAALRPLPRKRFEYGEWGERKVSIDYHIVIDKNFYSAPYIYAGEHVDIRTTASTVEIFRKGKRIASHRRSYQKWQYHTAPSHMPASHRAHREWTPSRLIEWARKKGPKTGYLVKTILENRPHPEQGYRSCLGLMRLAKRYGDARLEQASSRALFLGSASYKTVSNILAKGMDQQPLPALQIESSSLPAHENIRGPEYYQ